MFIWSNGFGFDGVHVFIMRLVFQMYKIQNQIA